MSAQASKGVAAVADGAANSVAVDAVADGTATSAVANPDSFINYLSQTLAAANAYLTQQLHDAGLEGVVPSHGSILIQLFEQKTITMQELSERIHRDPSTVTALVKKLVDGGYVETHKSDEDRRRTEVSLTSKGKRMRRSFERISTDLRAVQMQGIDPEEFATACKVLAQVRANFQETL